MGDDFGSRGVESGSTMSQMVSFLDSTGVTMTSTPADPGGLHGGTGDYNTTWQVIKKSTVPGTGLLSKDSTNGRFK